MVHMESNVRDHYIEHQTQTWMEKKAYIATQLRRLADEIERVEPSKGLGAHPYPNYAGAAYTVVHTITWGLANMHIDGLAKDAAEIDVYQAERQRDADLVALAAPPLPYWRDPNGDGWVDAWNGWYQTEEQAAEDCAGAIAENRPWKLEYGASLQNLG